MNKTWKNILFAALVALPLYFISCGKSSVDPDPDPNPSGNGFTAADFQLTIDDIYEPSENYSGEDYIRVEFTIKNVSTKTFQEGLNVHWKVKAADGAYYEYTTPDVVYGSPLNPGASRPSYAVINLGKPQNNPDRNTLTYTLMP